MKSERLRRRALAARSIRAFWLRVTRRLMFWLRVLSGLAPVAGIKAPSVRTISIQYRTRDEYTAAGRFLAGGVLVACVEFTGNDPRDRYLQRQFVDAKLKSRYIWPIFRLADLQHADRTDHSLGRARGRAVVVGLSGRERMDYDQTKSQIFWIVASGVCGGDRSR